MGNQKSEALHTKDGGKTWQNVTPEGVQRALAQQPPEHLEDVFLSSLVCLDPLNASKLWLAVPTKEHTLLAYTDDGGSHWQEHTTPVLDDGVDISFIDEKRDFLLVTSASFVRHMDKQLFGTVDGRQTWRRLAVPAVSSWYSNGIYLRTASQGWMNGTYHGGDAVPLYHT